VEDGNVDPEVFALKQAEAAAAAEGLPSAAWRWLGPWLLDCDNFGVDRTIGDLMSDPDGSDLPGRTLRSSSDAVQFAAFEQVASQADGSRGSDGGGWLFGGLDWPKHDVGYSRTGGRAKLVRCRRWVRPRERIVVQAPPAAGCASEVAAVAALPTLASPSSPSQSIADGPSSPLSPPPPQYDLATESWVSKAPAIRCSNPFSSAADAPPPYGATTVDTTQLGQEESTHEAAATSAVALSAEEAAELE
jgi:hypothetical protein